MEERKEKAFIKCTGCAAMKKTSNNHMTCSERVLKGFEEEECHYGCVGAGDCILSCKYGAISQKDGKVIIDENKCNGCGDCVHSCPQHLIHMIPKEATNYIPCSNKDPEEITRELCGYGCIGCGDCEKACYQGAITVKDNIASIDYSKCVGCDACTVSCRKKIIVDTYHDLSKLKNEIAFVKCTGGANNRNKFDHLGFSTCMEAACQIPDDICKYGCCGFGDCTKVCRYDALHMVDGTAYVDPDKCVGCGDCVAMCPQKLIELVPYHGSKIVACASKDDSKTRERVCQTGCSGCKDCIENCPNHAIYTDGNKVVIRCDECESCSICQYVCSRKVIATVTIPESIYKQAAALKSVCPGLDEKNTHKQNKCTKTEVEGGNNEH